VPNYAGPYIGLHFLRRLLHDGKHKKSIRAASRRDGLTASIATIVFDEFEKVTEKGM